MPLIEKSDLSSLSKPCIGLKEGNLYKFKKINDNKFFTRISMNYSRIFSCEECLWHPE